MLSKSIIKKVNEILDHIVPSLEKGLCDQDQAYEEFKSELFQKVSHITTSEYEEIIKIAAKKLGV